MPAYVIVDIDVQDRIIYEEYKRLAPASIAQYGGKYLARGGVTEVLEGDWTPKRFVILQFESLARAKEWFDSPEYALAKNLRLQSATTHMIVTEGVQDSLN
ncbi:DUF1330 domain-containing protein [bacterium]|nr:DUF1330 domain-containing protein [bacterium]MCI0606630.1 DUF1330 domain-containing protein [bacterium]